MSLRGLLRPSGLLAVGAFVLATVSLSHVLSDLRQAFGGGLSGQGTLDLAFWGALLVLSFGGLLFRSYMASRSEGKVAHPIWFFEQLAQRISREKHAL